MDIAKKIKSTVCRRAMEVYSIRKADEVAINELLPRLANKKLIELTSSEKEDVDSYFSMFGSKFDYRYWQLYKLLGGFSPCMISDEIYVRYILRVLNPIKYSITFQDKSCYSSLLHSVNQPSTIVKCVNGTLRDGAGKIITRAVGAALIQACGDVIMKPTTGSCAGQGVKRIKSDDRENLFEIEEIVKSYGDSFIAQERVKQSELTACFNESSLNTFRVNTLNLNDKVSATNIMFRHGRNGAVVDNGGAGGICCGIDAKGRFVGIAVDSKLNKYETTSFGEKYRDLVIPEVSNLIEVAVEAHNRHYPMMGLVGWDLALDENNNPILIEVNLSWPGIFLEQASNGAPIFGDRTKEVLDYCALHQDKLTLSEFISSWL